MTTTDDARLLEIEAREQAATPGPWLDDEDGRDDILPMLTVWPVSQPDDGCDERGYLLGHPVHIAHAITSRDQSFIAHSREDVRYLLDRLKAAESRIRDLEGALTASRDFFESGRFIRVEGAPITALRDKIALALQSDEVQEEGNGG